MGLRHLDAITSPATVHLLVPMLWCTCLRLSLIQLSALMQELACAACATLCQTCQPMRSDATNYVINLARAVSGPAPRAC